jgi:hypothetical protein
LSHKLQGLWDYGKPDSQGTLVPAKTSKNFRTSLYLRRQESRMMNGAPLYKRSRIVSATSKKHEHKKIPIAVLVALFLTCLGEIRAGEFRDNFRTLNSLQTAQGVELLRDHPRVPTVPQTRLSPLDLNYGLPERVAREHRESMERLRPEVHGRIEVGVDLTPQDLITSWTAGAPYLRKPYFPGLLRLNSGELLAFYSEGRGTATFGLMVAA